ncbi:MAG: prepilin-type N-terminal cleavage/methylation domain-containing protein [Elusimicrobiaceae bacterium]|nr:prepilin-type N-terminal cleavage/methylation domain-containing protein [Elusimicrobiaceae bacterium]
MKTNNMSLRTGFTLIELLVVVLIVSILAAVALPQYSTAVEKARATEALTLMSAVAGAAERYRLQKDEWPDGMNKLDVEVPQVTSGVYGGKNFTLTTNSSGATFTITATRSLNNANSVYTLTTLLTEASDGTISAVRSCEAGGTDGQKFCDAVTAGNNSNF